MRKVAALGSVMLSAAAVGALPVVGQPPAPTSLPESASVSREVSPGAGSRREQAYRKMFEGQRHMWKLQRMRTQAGRADSRRLATEAFQAAVVLDPTLAEAFTALSQLAVALQPRDIDEGIRQAELAIKADPQNLGGHRMLGRLLTVKSRLGSGPPDISFAAKARAEWAEVARLDTRNAEAWAFIAAFAEARGDVKEQIDAARKWLSAAPPSDVGFYEGVMGGASLAPESAAMKLASALARSGDTAEAAAVLSELIADDPENAEAMVLLGEIADTIEGPSAASTVSALRQAIYAGPSNVSLVDMLARLQGRLGQFDEAESLLKRHILSLTKSDSRAASTLAVSLAELFVQRDKYSDAAASLENALAIRGPGTTSVIKGEDREFVQAVFERLIRVGRLNDRPQAVKTYIERARKLFGKDDSFADRQMITVLQAQGSRPEALSLLRSLRANRPDDIRLLRLEATLLSDMGQVDFAVDLIRRTGKAASASPPTAGTGTIAIPVPASDEFSDLLFISNLYTRADRGKDAVEAANRALAIAAGAERRQIAAVTLATGLQTSGDLAGAERLLRVILRETPGNPMALNNLGYFLTDRGEKLEEAVEMIMKALKVDPKNAYYLDSLGFAYLKLGKLDEAEKYLTQAVRADPDSSAIYEHLGDLYRERKDIIRARSAWERAFRLASGPTEIERLQKKLGR